MTEDKAGVSIATSSNASTRRGLICIVVPVGHDRHQHLSDPFFLPFLGYLMDGLNTHGYAITITRANSAENPNWLSELADPNKCDGLLVIGQSDQFKEIERVADYYRPMVVWGAHVKDQLHCSVGCNNFVGGELAVKHLIDGGARSIALLGSKTAIEVAQRFMGAEFAAQTTDAELHYLPVHFALDDMEDEIAKHLNKMGKGIDGIFAASDLIAITAMDWLKRHRRKIPADVAVVGFDDLPISAQAHPPLTSIRQDIAAGAVAMVEKLLTRINGEDADSLVMKPKLIIRGSSLGNS
jgi:DNA-binding LacI/PurR family transcriptional regulator